MEGDELEFAAFEGSILLEHVNRQRMFQHFAIARFLAMLGLDDPGLSRDDMLHALADAGLIVEDGQGGHHVKAIMALTCATRLNRYPALRDRGIGLVFHREVGASAIRWEDHWTPHGYAIWFGTTLRAIMEYMPVLRDYVDDDSEGGPLWHIDVPEAAIRAFLLNAVVHQDFALSGPRPLVTIFRDRIEISNAGLPLIPADRFIDGQREDRNPAFARLMFNACKPAGEPQGMKLAMQAIEDAGLPPPLFAAADGVTIVTLYLPRAFAGWTPEERVRACFQHAQFRNRRSEAITAASLGARLGLADDAAETVAAVIRETLAAGLIKPREDGAGYAPAYA